MFAEFIPETIAPFLALAVLVVMFVGFIREVFPTEVIALSGAAFMLIMGLLPYDVARGVFSNPAPWTIAAMFILSGALMRTGALGFLTNWVKSNGAKNPKLTLAFLGLFVVLASAFMNNTPVVVIMIPIMMQFARKIGVAGSKLLIPLSYMAILGGMLTLIGTSTNLLVDGVARAEGMDPFGLFEVTPLALCLVLFGGIYLWILGPKLLPERTSMADMLGRSDNKKFITQVSIPKKSTLIGQNPLDVDLFKRIGARVIDVLRGDESLRRTMKDVTLKRGDRLVIKAAVGELLELNEGNDVQVADANSSKETVTVEALITPGCRMIGRTLGALRLRRRFGIYTLAVHRSNQNIGSQLDDVKIRVGDTVLFEGAEEDIARMAREMNVINLAAPSDLPMRRSHAPIAVGSLAAVVLLAALGVAPIFSLAVIAVAVVFLTRAIDADEAFQAVDGQLLVLIFSMLAIGAGLQESGAVAMLANWISPVLVGLPPFFLIWTIYLLTSVLTEMASNNAVAVVVTPIAIALGHQLGIDPRPLVVAVMVAASASFATPIGYQTNTLVYGPGGYSFMDFMKIGIPLNVSIGILASVLIPFFWAL
ncbi:MAG: SLC13 family permease [Pseudomonadota bacterium]